MAYTNLSGKKLQSKLGAILNESASSHSPALLSSDASFAKRQLEKMGWTEGTGLGKRRNGLVNHIKIKQRDEEMGLGREKELARSIGDVWWKDCVGGTLARLQAQKGKDKGGTNKSKKRSDGGNSFKLFTDEELFQATGGARFGMRAQRRAEGKWKRTESGSDIAKMEKQAQGRIEWNGRGNAKVKMETDTSIMGVVGNGDEDGNSSCSKLKRRKVPSVECEDLSIITSSSNREVSDGFNDNGEKVRIKEEKRGKKGKKEGKKRKKLHRISSEEDAPVDCSDASKKQKKMKRRKKQDD